MGPGSHESGEDWLTGSERVAHQFDVEQSLEDGSNAYDPEQGEAVFDECGWTEEEFSAADGGAEDDDSRAYGREPAEAARDWWFGELGDAPGIEA